MKTSGRLAGIFASAAFLIVCGEGMMTTMNPIQSILYGLATGLVLGLIGHKIGYIISHPQNKHKKKKQDKGFSKQASQGDKIGMELTPMTGEESFLEDLM